MACARFMGLGDKEQVDQAAVDAMRPVLGTVRMNGVVVIGEGEKEWPARANRQPTSRDDTVATPADAQEVCAAIRGRLSDRYGANVGERIRILYGGSVKASTSAAIIAQPDIDGALVGRASLDPDELAAIWQSAHLTVAAYQEG